MKKIKLRCEILPADPGGPAELKDYEVQVDGEATVLDVLRMIYRDQDDRITFHGYCRQGLCAGCVVELNGRRVLACKTPAEGEMIVRPFAAGQEED